MGMEYLWDVVKKVSMHITGIPEAKRENCPTIFEEIQGKPHVITSEANH